MNTKYTDQDRGDKQSYRHYLEAMDAISIEKVASASAFFESKKGNTIVDVGMASGTSTAILAQLFPDMNIIGVDINPKMIEIAQEQYQLPNLSFREDDGERLSTFEKDSVNGFFNCSAIHHITSYNNYDNNRALNTLQRQTELLKDRGILVVRDFLKPDEQEVILELSSQDKDGILSDSELLLQFARTARSLAPLAERGFPVEELFSEKKNIRRFRLFYTDAVEFVRRKDYYANWDIELQEEYGYMTQREFEEAFKNLGLRIIISSPIYNQWIINNRYRNRFSIYDTSGKEIGFPPTNYMIAGEKVQGGKKIHLVRHLPLSEKPFLQYSSYQKAKSKEVFDIVERPNEVLDILPYYQNGDKITILAKHGYPRPLVCVDTDSPALDGKHYSGYITEGIAVSEKHNIEAILSERFNISNYNSITPSLSYYPSSGGINEKVSSVFVELNQLPATSTLLKDGFSVFKESGFIHRYDAMQLLNTAQTGALVDARLELNIYNLFIKNNIALPKWFGETIQPKFELRFKRAATLDKLLSVKKQEYIKTEKKGGFLTARKACFSEAGMQDSNAALEYVHPSHLSSNTLVTLPICRANGEIYVGLEVRDLPVPQIYTGNSTLITAPARRLPKDVRNMSDLHSYISEMSVGERGRVKQYFKLGEKYFPSVGVTTEQVYPYVVCLDSCRKDLEWVSLNELHENLDKLQCAHLLICITRLKHALEKEHNIVTISNLILFLRAFWNTSDDVITKDTLIEKDLGITGDEGDDMLLLLEQEFNVKFADSEGSIHTAFGLNEGEYLFHGEGTFIFLCSDSSVVPLTVGWLYRVMLELSKK